jgi:cellulose 1,4-beta-cellobiosidase
VLLRYKRRASLSCKSISHLNITLCTLEFADKMKYSFGLVALAAFATAAPTVVEKEAAKIAPRAACTTAVKLTAGSNPFSGKKFYANEYYAGEVAAAVAQMSDASLAAKATKVGQVGSFLWMYVVGQYT